MIIKIIFFLQYTWCAGMVCQPYCNHYNYYNCYYYYYSQRWYRLRRLRRSRCVRIHSTHVYKYLLIHITLQYFLNGSLCALDKLDLCALYIKYYCRMPHKFICRQRALMHSISVQTTVQLPSTHCRHRCSGYDGYVRLQRTERRTAEGIGRQSARDVQTNGFLF